MSNLYPRASSRRRSLPHRHTSTLRGICRPHEGHCQPVRGASLITLAAAPSPPYRLDALFLLARVEFKDQAEDGVVHEGHALRRASRCAPTMISGAAGPGRSMITFCPCSRGSRSRPVFGNGCSENASPRLRSNACTASSRAALDGWSSSGVGDNVCQRRGCREGGRGSRAALRSGAGAPGPEHGDEDDAPSLLESQRHGPGL